jgi:hypothetical protein
MALPSLAGAKRTLPNLQPIDDQANWMAKPLDCLEIKRETRHARELRASSSQLLPTASQPRIFRDETTSRQHNWGV